MIWLEAIGGRLPVYFRHVGGEAQPSRPSRENTFVGRKVPRGRWLAVVMRTITSAPIAGKLSPTPHGCSFVVGL